MDNNISSSLSPSRGYFSGPEGKVNATTWGALALAAIFMVWFMGGKIGDYIVEAFDNTLHMAIVGGILFAIIAALVDPKKRIWYVFRSIIRMLTSWFIELDPIGIRKSYVERAQAQYAQFTKAVGDLRGQLNSTKRSALENQSLLNNFMTLCKVAETKGDQRAMISSSRNVERATILQHKYDNALDKLNGLTKTVIRYQEICGDTITDLQYDIQFREKDMALVKSTRSISGSIMNILKGLPEKDMYDEAGLVLDKQYDDTFGAFENILDLTKDIVSNANLQDEVSLQNALNKIHAFEQTSANVLVKGQVVSNVEIMQQAKQISASPASSASAASTPTHTNTDYTDLLK